MTTTTTFSFKNLAVPQQEISGIRVPHPRSLDDVRPEFAFEKLSDSKLDFGDFGGWHVAIRGGVVRLAFVKLTATGVLAALVAMNALSSNVSFSCSLAAAVNFTAAIHYLLIWKIRAQNLPRSYVQWSAKRNTDGQWMNKEDDDVTESKFFGQELAVDSLRYSDWTVTLVLMVLDLFELAEHATGGKKPFLDKYVCSALMPVMIGFGAIHRFWYNDARGDVGGWKKVVAWVSFGVSCGIFTVVLWSLNAPLVDDDVCPASALPSGTDGSGKCPVLDTDLNKDKVAVMLLSFVWIGYPLVGIASSLWQGCWNQQKDTFYTGTLSLFKDISYSTLDITSKAGLALYACYRSHWVV